jgi:hypothetical protein
MPKIPMRLSDGELQAEIDLAQQRPESIYPVFWIVPVWQERTDFISCHCL